MKKSLTYTVFNKPFRLLVDNEFSSCSVHAPKEVNRIQVIESVLSGNVIPFVVDDIEALPETELNVPVVLPYQKFTVEFRDIDGVKTIASVGTHEGKLKMLVSFYGQCHDGQYHVFYPVVVTFNRSSSDFSDLHAIAPSWFQPSEIHGRLKEVCFEKVARCLHVVHSMCSAITAGSASFDVKAPSKLKALKAKKKGIPTLPETRVIKLSNGGQRSSASSQGEGDGTGKRAHWRRSHIRRYKSGLEIVIAAYRTTGARAVNQEYHF